MQEVDVPPPPARPVPQPVVEGQNYKPSLVLSELNTVSPHCMWTSSTTVSCKRTLVQTLPPSRGFPCFLMLVLPFAFANPPTLCRAP